MAVEQLEPLNVREELAKLTPPDYWERQVFEAAAVLGKEVDEVAGDYNQSRPETLRMIAKVRDWLMLAPDDAAGDLPPTQARRLAARMVRLRMEKVMSIAMECFEESRGKVTIEKVRNLGTERIEETITRPGYGDLRYLTHYRQTALALAKLDGVCLRPEVAQPDREELEAQAAWMRNRTEQDKAEERREVLLEERAEQRKEQVLREMAMERVLEPERVQEMESFLAEVEEARANRPADALSEEQLAAEKDLYSEVKHLLQSHRDARMVLDGMDGVTTTSDEAPEYKSVTRVIRPAQKTANNPVTPVSPNAPVADRRKAFLSGTPVAEVA